MNDFQDAGRQRPLLGRMAVQYNLLTEEELHHGLELQVGERAGEALGTILITEGALTPEQLRFLLRLQSTSLDRLDPDTRMRLRKVLLGKVLTRTASLPRGTLREVLRNPDALDRLEQELLSLGLARPEHIEQTEQFLRERVLLCSSCYAPYLLKDRAEAAGRSCEWCNAALSKPPSPDESRMAAEAHTLHVGAPAMPAQPTLRPGAYFAGHEVLEILGEGGMGIVYRAKSPSRPQPVAIKVMRAGATASDTDKRRFLREAEAAATLRHPNVVPVYDVGEVQGVYYYTMEYVEGRPLHQEREAVAMGPEQVVRLMVRVADGIHYAHTRGIIHRDLKPANIMIDRGGEPLIVDFGLAKLTEGAEAGGDSMAPATITGAILGTPQYMSPEQAGGATRDIDIRSDVYSLGVILYELLTGVPPHSADNLMDLVRQINQEEPVAPGRISGEVDRDLESVVLKCLEKERDRRYQSARELKEDLERYLKGWPVRARRAGVGYRVAKWVRRNRTTAVTVALSVLLVGALAGWVAVDAWNRDRNLRQKVRGLVKEARERIDQGDFAAAVDRLDTAFGLRPEDTDVVSLRVETRKLDAEARDRAKALALSDQGRRELAGGDYDAALATFRAALQTYALPEAAEGLSAAQEAKSRARDDVRRREAQTALDQADGLAERSRAAGDPARSRDLLVAALLAYDRALALDPEHEAAREHKGAAAVGLARMAVNEGDYGLALFMARQAEVLTPGAEVEKLMAAIVEARDRLSEYRDHLRHGDELAAGGDWDGALRYYALAGAVRATEELDRRSRRARFNQAMERATARMEARDWPGALEALVPAEREAEDLANPTYHERVQELTAELHRRALADSLEQARASYRRGLDEADPDRARPHLQAALAALQVARGHGEAAEVLSLEAEVRIRLDTPTGMRYHPGGRVRLGSDEDGRVNPVRTVDLPPFYVGETEVTHAAYLRFVEDSGYRRPELWLPEVRERLGQFQSQDGKPGPAGWKAGRYPDGASSLPVTGICWYEAAAYAAWAGLRLPTEAEWEAAAGWDPVRSARRQYPWGDVFRPLAGNFTGEGPRVTGSYPDDRSPVGCLDMGGNVSEWTAPEGATSGGPEPGAAPADGGPATSVPVKGGNWRMVPPSTWARASFRKPQDPFYRGDVVGFRLARSARR